MKFQTTRGELLGAILFSGRAISTKTSAFILNGILLEAGKELNLYTTDLETSIRTSVKVKTEEEGKVVVPAKILANILKSLGESKIELFLNKESNQVELSCGNAKFVLNTLSLEEFPGFPEINKKNTLNININRLRKIVTKVQRASSIDENRIILTGILMEISKNNLKMVATDSYRLASCSGEIKGDYPDLSVVVPAKILDSVVKSDIDGEDIEINTEEKQITFIIKKAGEVQNIIVSRLISGKFPDYKQLIPESMKYNILIDKEKILETVRRISSISQDNVPVKIIMDKGKITAAMDIKEIGSSSEDFEVSYDGETLEMAFNPDFLIDGLTMIDGKNIIFSIEEPLKPVLMTSEKEDGLLYLLMPIRVS